MDKIVIIFLFISVLNYVSFAQSNDLIIKNVKYVDVEEGIIKEGSIKIENGIISEISNKAFEVSDISVLDGDGKYLTPGLIDAHIHMFQSGGIYTRPDAIDLTEYRSYPEEIQWLKDNAADLLQRYLRLGITSVIDVGGPLYNYTLRDSFQGRHEYANLFVTGPLVSTYQPEAFKIKDPPIIKVHSKEEAIALVQSQLAYKPDFIKIWYIVLPGQSADSTFNIVQATIDESHKNGLKVAVHATQLNTAKLAVKAGADILVHSVDNPVDDEFIEFLLESNVAYIPTLVVASNYAKSFEGKNDLNKEDFQFSNPIPLGSLFDQKHYLEGNNLERIKPHLDQINQRNAVNDSIRRANLKMLSDRGVLIATGTDAGNIGTLHASSYYHEIDNMKLAGLSNAAILKASTINAARAIGKEHLIGSIEKGKQADLLLLNSDPLESLDALKDLALVIQHGHVMELSDIHKESPENLVQQQLNGYNARDIEAFVAPYSEDVELYDFQEKLIYKGKDKMRNQYALMFDRVPSLHCELVNRIVMGNIIIDHERISGFGKGRLVEASAVYKIEAGEIVEVHFLKSK